MAKRQADEGEDKRSSNKCPCVENQREMRQVLVSGLFFMTFLSCSEERDNGGQHFTVY